jgi:hypothetical protein
LSAVFRERSIRRQRNPDPQSAMTDELRSVAIGDFRREAIEHVSGVLMNRKWPSLDELIFTVRRPLRTVLLSLIEIEHAEPGVSKNSFSLADRTPQPPPNKPPGHLAAAYLDVAATRPKPSVLRVHSSSGSGRENRLPR